MSGFTILTVCTGNICRSPIAAQLLRAELADDRIAVRSAGVYAMVGDGMPEEARLVSRSLGGDPDGHHPTQLSPAVLSDVDLVLTAELRHRADVVRMHPRASRHAFTLKQFARLASLVDDNELTTVDAPAAALQLIASKRGIAAPVPVGDDEIVDPYLKPFRAYEECGREIAGTVTAIARVFNASR